MKSLDWMADAVCAQTDPDLFFPEGAGQNTNKAKKICAACPVRIECGKHAQHLEGDVSHGLRHGAWGGQSPTQRAAAGGPSLTAARDEAILRLTAHGVGPGDISGQLGVNYRTVLRVRAGDRQEEAA
ncbi:WhiB family transcriptional regulator [Streptomyces sp. NBC_01201]|uniref:WhiB family transcriptional regulator n=1 Tax=Streptomyces sp. NBC_01201 TaxID=2903770 RepID=UPI002E133C7A|nr:WhiB family transcriptional regulator [Streptomyces sp. NBC_01201]